MRDKHALRAELKSWRRSLDDADVARMSRAAIDSLMGIIPWPDVESMHTYLPLPGEREVDTRLLVEAVRRQCPHVRVATWQQPSGNPAASRWLDSSGLTVEPVPRGYRFSAVIVPVLGFTEDCHRLGFGGGFYDRFLTSQPEALTVGLAYEHARTRFAPEPHDIALDIIVTERSYISRAKGHSR